LALMQRAHGSVVYTMISSCSEQASVRVMRKSLGTGRAFSPAIGR
jgi:hypothetical protein